MTGTAQDFWTHLAEAPQGSRFERVNIPEHCLVALSPGEIQGQLAMPRAALLHETTLPGIWWVQEQGGNDYLEVGLCPAVVFQAGLAGTTTAPPWPDGLMNAPGLLAEALAHAQAGQALQLNLGMLPFNEADRAFLDQLSQQAAVRNAHLALKGYGDTVAEKTILSRLWRVRHFNVHGTLVLDTLEVATVPAVIMATDEDWQTSRQHLLQRD